MKTTPLIPALGALNSIPRALGYLVLLLLLTGPAWSQSHYLPGALPTDSVTALPPFPGWYYSNNAAFYQGEANLSRSLFHGRVPLDLRLKADVFAKYPDRRQTMIKLWDDYVQRNGVILTDDGPFVSRKP